MPGAAKPATMIRPLARADLPDLQAVIGETGLFPPEMLEGMVAPHLAGEAPQASWLVALGEDGRPLGLAYAAPERMTLGTWNLLLIAVRPARQGTGLGSALLRAVEAALPARGGRLLIVETSGLPDFEGARVFYRRRGYAEEARIRDFYAPGEDKVVFTRPLADAKG